MDKRRKNPLIIKKAENIYDNPWIGLEHYEIEKPNGENGIYGVVRFKNIATGVIPIDSEGNIYLIGQYRFPLETYSWEIPEGGCPQGEEPLKAAKRELLEETGLVAKYWEPLMEMDMSNSVTDEHCHIFLAKELQKGTPHPEDTEVLEVKKVSFEEAVKMVFSGEIMDAVSVAAILKLKVLKLQNIEETKKK